MLKNNAFMEFKYFLYQPVKLQIIFFKYMLAVYMYQTASTMAVLGEFCWCIRTGIKHHAVNSKPDSLTNKIYSSSGM